MEWANNFIIEMTPWFLKTNINVVGLDYNSNIKYTLMAHHEGVNSISLGCYSQSHFQSLIDSNVLKDFKQCIACSRVFKNLKNHLSKASACKKLYKIDVFLNHLDNLTLKKLNLMLK